MKRLLKDKRGEGFVDVCVLVLAIAMVLALVVRIAPVFVAKQNLDVFADELVRTAEINGQVGSATSAKAADLREQTGLDPNISWSDTGKIQLGNEVEVLTADGRKVKGILTGVESDHFVVEVEKQVKPEGCKRKMTVKEPVTFAYTDIKTTKYIFRFK